EPVGCPGTEAGRGTVGGEREVRRVEQGAQVEQFERPGGEASAVDEPPADPVAGPGVLHRLPPAVRGDGAAAGEQVAEVGAVAGFDVDDVARREVEHAVPGGEGTGGPVGGEAAEEFRGGSFRAGGGRGHPSTSRSAMSA